MSDEPKPTRRFDPTDGKGVPWGIVMALLGFVGMGTGAGGTVLGTSQLSAELREFRVEVRGELSRLGSSDVTEAAPYTFASGDSVSFEVSFPVSGW